MKAYIDTEAKEIRVIGSVDFSELEEWIRMHGDTEWKVVEKEDHGVTITTDGGGIAWQPYPNDSITIPCTCYLTPGASCSRKDCCGQTTTCNN